MVANKKCRASIDRYENLGMSKLFGNIQFRLLLNIVNNFSEEYFCQGNLMAQSEFDKLISSTDKFGGFNVIMNVSDPLNTDEKYVAIFEHKDLPIFGMNFNPSQFKVPNFLTQASKDPSNVKFARDLAFEFIDLVKSKKFQLNEIPGEIKSYYQHYSARSTVIYVKRNDQFISELIQETNFPNDYPVENAHLPQK